ncbi:MAG TPA: sugar ABC transporter permease, partial [Anaerolineaceae bacterium]|nr:sugar ABC transporter permease [Anaerolineaceae bacterium]
MEANDIKPKTNNNIISWFATGLGRILVSIFVPVLTFLVLWQGFLFLRNSNTPQIVLVIVAIIWGVGGVALLYAVTNWVIEKLPGEWSRRLLPFVFVGPALAILAWYLLIPTFRTLYYSFMDANSFNFVGLSNYVYAFTNPIMLEAFRNNLLWLIFGTSFSVGMGLLIAVLADRSRFESFYKALIFMPMAISFVGAGVIWKFVYAYNGTGSGIQQIGLLNAIVVSWGGTPQAWLELSPWNNFFLIIIMVWLQTGYAMVILSSAIKGVPADLMEAARIDGASEVQAFFSIIIPYIQGTLLTVTTTIIIFSLKLFDIVRVMTGGNYGTNVIANEFYLERFSYGQDGRAAAIAVVLLIAVIPV